MITNVMAHLCILVYVPVRVIGTSGGNANNPYILKALEPIFKSLHDAHRSVSGSCFEILAP